MECYLDNSATTKCFTGAARLVEQVLCGDYGNPSSMHRKGVEAERYLRYAKETIAKILKVDEKEIYFTSGGTEADNLALTGCAFANCRAGKHLITTAIEHPAVLQTMKYLESQGFEVTYLPVDGQGRVRLQDLQQSMRPDTILVSIMHTNNEIGSLQPVAEAGAFLKQYYPGVLFHVDAVQGFGKCRIYPRRMGIDLLAASGHKIHGPKGVGFLYVSEKAKIHPVLFGGGQQRGLRSGTENVPGIAGLASAAQEIYASLEEDVERLYEYRQYLTDGLLRIPQVRVNGPAGREGAPHVVSASFPGIRSEVLLHALEEKQIYVSAGSACASNRPEQMGSATLRAIGLAPEFLSSTLRFSLSVMTRKEELDETLRALYELVPMLRRFTRR